MTDALIGYSGFVGSTLRKQKSFEALYRSTNISDISNRRFDQVACAGAPAQKWIANRDPEMDRQRIDDLIGHLKTIECKTFILISTVDVFRRPTGVDERTAVDESGLHAYGLNRRRLEVFVENHFSNHLIIRLPGLVGPGLRKNIIFDFLNSNNLSSVDCRSVFQFYPMTNLWLDIQLALDANLRLLHLTAEPVSVSDVAALGFGRIYNHVLPSRPASYDMRSCHADVFGGAGEYQYNARASIQAIRAYAQSEPLARLPEEVP